MKSALLASVAERRIIAAEGVDLARGWLLVPGSTLKPLTLWALLEAGKLKASDEYLCPGTLRLAGHSLNCSHPVMTIPMNVSRAIAYSCNCAVAHFAERLETDELSNFLRRLNIFSPSGLVAAPEAVGTAREGLAGPQLQLQALGEANLRITALELAIGYRALARRSKDAVVAPILEGLEGAVEYGTAQRAALRGVRVAGKTGTVESSVGVPAAWFAGFAPSRAPEVVVTVLVQGASGGADAAPVAGRLLESYFASRR